MYLWHRVSVCIADAMWRSERPVWGSVAAVQEFKRISLLINQRFVLGFTGAGQHSRIIHLSEMGSSTPTAGYRTNSPGDIGGVLL